MDRKQSREELKARIDELEQVTSSLKMVLKEKEDQLSLMEFAENISMTGCWSLNLESGHQEWSPGEYRIHGLAQEISHSFETHLQCIHPEDRKKYATLFKEHLNSDQTRFTQEYRIQTEDGRIKYIQADYQFLRDRAGQAHTAYGADKDITEQKQAEQTLQQSEKKYRLLAETMADIVWTTDLEFKTNYVSPSVEKVLGFTPEERYRQTADEMLTPDSLHKAQEALLEFLKQKEEGKPIQEFINIDVEYYTKEGSTVWMECNVKLLFDLKGETTGILGVSRDITLRRKAEELLKTNELWMRGIFNAMDESLFVVGTDRKLIHVNSATCKMFGYSKKELLDQSTEILHVDHGHYIEFGKQIKQLFGSGRVENFEFEAKRKNGEIFPSEHSLSRLLDDSGDPIGIVSVVRDISDRKLFQNQLIDSKKEWEDIFQAIGHPTIILDPEHGIINANRSMLKLSGFSEKQLLGKKCFDVFHKAAQPPESCPMQSLLHSGSLESVEMVMEALDRNFLVTCTPVVDKNGNIEKVIHIATDITETKRLESQLRQSLKMEALGTLSGGIAHEFNNLLGIILGNTELAIVDVPEWNPARECLEEIRTASLRAKNVVRQILSFSHKMPATRKPVNISTIIQESLKLVRATIPTNIDIRKEILCESEIILGNSTEINQIFINLCNNSVHAMEGETGALSIRLEMVILDSSNLFQYTDLAAGEYVKLTIKDNGYGIDPKIKGLIFDPYFTTKDIDQGLGMGLAVVYGIVKKHDGDIQVSSVVGKGTTVEVLFPVTKEKTKVNVEELHELPGGTERILCVDDEHGLVRLLTKILEQQGYRVVGKTSSREALKLFQNESDNFDLVITDMAMPEMPGDRLAKEIVKVCKSMPVIICN